MGMLTEPRKEVGHMTFSGKLGAAAKNELLAGKCTQLLSSTANAMQLGVHLTPKSSPSAPRPDLGCDVGKSK